MYYRKKINLSIALICCVIFISYPKNLLSQEASSTSNLFKAGFLNPGISFEKATGKKQTLYFNAFLSPYFSFLYSSNLGTSTDFRLEPSLSLHYRFYYNGSTRARKEKFTERNSMNYLAPIYNVVFSKRRMSSSHYEETSMRPVHTVAFSWGLQRNYKNRFSLDFSFGPGVLFTKSSAPDANGNPVKNNYSSFTIVSEVNIGIWLNSRTKKHSITERL